MVHVSKIISLVCVNKLQAKVNQQNYNKNIAHGHVHHIYLNHVISKPACSS